MGLLDLIRRPVQPVTQVPAFYSPMEMIGSWLANGQVAWFSADSTGLIKETFMDNHVVFTIQDWKSSKVASAPPLLNEIKDEKAYKQYRQYVKSISSSKDDTNFLRARDLRHKALTEVPDHDILKVLQRPNGIMTAYEFFYGLQTYIDIVGAGYLMAVRDGVDPTEGRITEMYLPPAHQMAIVSGTPYEPIKEYFLNSSPDKKINAKNVCQIRNFSPDYTTSTQWLYGQSRLLAAKKLLQRQKDGTETEVALFQNQGVREMMFPKGMFDPGDVPLDQANSAAELLNKKIRNSGNGGIITSNVEMGSIKIGFTPSELGILDSLKDSKKDLCAIYHIPDAIFNWDEHTTYNNMAEKRKIGLVDAVLPELEKIKDALNYWLVPSYEKPGRDGKNRFVIDYDLDFFPELQADREQLSKWIDSACLTANERRELFGYGQDLGENSNKALIPSGLKILDDEGLGSFGSNEEEVF